MKLRAKGALAALGLSIAAAFWWINREPDPEVLLRRTVADLQSRQFDRAYQQVSPSDLKINGLDAAKWQAFCQALYADSRIQNAQIVISEANPGVKTATTEPMWDRRVTRRYNVSVSPLPAGWTNPTMIAVRRGLDERWQVDAIHLTALLGLKGGPKDERILALRAALQKASLGRLVMTARNAQYNRANLDLVVEGKKPVTEYVSGWIRSQNE
jgi:hypothetical protein